MGQDQAAPHSKMDDLLASLRKGLGTVVDIDETPGAPNAENLAEEQGGANSGSMPRKVSPSDEISALRKRIAGKIGRELQPNGFASILSGRSSASVSSQSPVPEVPSLDRVIPPSSGPQPVLRQSLNDDEAADFEQFPLQAPKSEAERLRTRTRPLPRAAQPGPHVRDLVCCRRRVV
jgi:hypothetical protein